ncbi:hypothetical protein CNYM01_13443 [Colletotrichum nymphaeae SA-01]|uniref:Cyclin-like domain-containing protein n=1 Tax=Colletotrichum nymphaeae SA-01 TaxID=1460502 RepID=A0A135T9M5_9PEZI|nr:hypothetical protein CNYM01_13443 [Colletotrichum nymphaeae SA-01]
MRKVLKRYAVDLWSPEKVPIAKRQKTALSRTHELNDEQHDTKVATAILTNTKAETIPDMSRFPDGIREMRPNIVRLLQVAHGMLGLLPETLFLSINLVDRFCCEQSFCGEVYYKLISCASLWIASKNIEEKGRVPPLQQVMCFVPRGYYRDEKLFIRLELYILTVLKWRVNHPTPYCFIQLLEMDDVNEVAAPGHLFWLVNVCY